MKKYFVLVFLSVMLSFSQRLTLKQDRVPCQIFQLIVQLKTAIAVFFLNAALSR